MAADGDIGTTQSGPTGKCRQYGKEPTAQLFFLRGSGRDRINLTVGCFHRGTLHPEKAVGRPKPPPATAAQPKDKRSRIGKFVSPSSFLAAPAAFKEDQIETRHIALFAVRNADQVARTRTDAAVFEIGMSSLACIPYTTPY